MLIYIKIIGVERINNIILNLMKESNESENMKSKYKNIIYINYGLNLISKKGLVTFLGALIFKKKLIVHWIGSDLYSLLLDTRKSKMKKNASVFLNKMFNVTNWVASPLLKEELKELGITSEVVYIPTELVRAVDILPLPAEVSFISYLPKTNHEFYGSKLVFQLAKNYPDIEFHIVANDGEGMPEFENIKYHGWVNELRMDELYNNTYGVIRLPIHDALGGTVIEAVLRGRYAIWTFEASYVFTANNYDQLESSIQKISKKTKPNFSGSQYIQEHFNYDKLRDDFKKKINSVSQR